MWETPFCFSISELLQRINALTSMGLVLMEFSNLSIYKTLNTQVVFAYLLELFKSWVTLQFWFVVVLKSSKEFLRYEMHILYPLVDVSICFTHLLDCILNACSKFCTHFALLIYFKMWICCCFTIRNHEALLHYVGTPQWGPQWDNFAQVFIINSLLSKINEIRDITKLTTGAVIGTFEWKLDYSMLSLEIQIIG